MTRQAVALSVALAGMYAATDWLDAVVERKLAESSVALAGRGGARVWFVGHAGFGYYAGRAGAAPVAPGDRLEEDDRVIVPVDWPVAQAIDWPDDALERVGQSPPLPERRRHTLPTYYAGKVPVEHRDAGRAAVVYRVRAAFVARPRPR